MIGGVTRRILPHPSGVLQLCVKKPLEKYLSNAERRAENETRSGSKVSRTPDLSWTKKSGNEIRRPLLITLFCSITIFRYLNQKSQISTAEKLPQASGTRS